MAVNTSGDNNIKHYLFVMYGLHSKLVRVSKLIKGTNNRKTLAYYLQNLSISVNYESVMFYGTSTCLHYSFINYSQRRLYNKGPYVLKNISNLLFLFSTNKVGNWTLDLLHLSRQCYLMASMPFESKSLRQGPYLTHFIFFVTYE
jgi:hypothetical protein